MRQVVKDVGKVVGGKRQIWPGGVVGWVPVKFLTPEQARPSPNLYEGRMTQYGSLYWSIIGMEYGDILRYFYGIDIEFRELP